MWANIFLSQWGISIEKNLQEILYSESISSHYKDIPVHSVIVLVTIYQDKTNVQNTSVQCTRYLLSACIAMEILPWYTTISVYRAWTHTTQKSFCGGILFNFFPLHIEIYKAHKTPYNFNMRKNKFLPKVPSNHSACSNHIIRAAIKQLIAKIYDCQWICDTITPWISYKMLDAFQGMNWPVFYEKSINWQWKARA